MPLYKLKGVCLFGGQLRSKGEGRTSEPATTTDKQWMLIFEDCRGILIKVLDFSLSLQVCLDLGMWCGRWAGRGEGSLRWTGLRRTHTHTRKRLDCFFQEFCDVR